MFVIVVSVENAVYVIIGLLAVAVTVSGQGVAVKFRISFMSEVEVDVIVPYVRIFTVFFCQAHGIFYVSGTDVVRG